MTELSIVIVSWNTSKILHDCLESLYENLKSEAEVWVVDNASEDDSVKMVKENFPAVKIIENHDNFGFATANNQAFENCNGKWILMLNSDTLILKDVIEKSIMYLEENHDVGAMGCRVLNPDFSMQATCFQYPTLLNLFLKITGMFKFPFKRFFGKEHMSHWRRDSEREVDVITGCYILFRKEILTTVGPLDTTFYFCGEETDWCKRIKDHGWKLKFSPVGEIIHIGNASGKKLNYKRDLLLTEGITRFHKKHYGILKALTVFTMLYIFNFSRFLYWRSICLLKNNEKTISRKNHFSKIIINFTKSWPKEKY
jgi:GT2 family glycosyltransferase